MRRIIKLAAVAAIVAAGIYVFKNFDSLLGNFSCGIKLMDTPTVVKEIKKISELTTATYVEDAVIKDTAVKKRSVSKLNLSNSLFKGEVMRNSEEEDKWYVVQVATGRVRVGFDLSKVEEGDITANDTTLQITLPPAEVLDVVMNPSDVKTFYDEKKGEWSDAELHEARTSIQTKAMEQLKGNAIQNGIIEKAEAIGIAKLSGMFKGFGFKEVTVSIKH